MSEVPNPAASSQADASAPRPELSGLPSHAPMRQFAWKQGEPLVGGRLLSEIAAELHGATFVYDRQVMQSQVAGLRAVLPPGVRVHYAMKANPMPAVVTHMASLVDGIDVASGGELQTALQACATNRAPTEPSDPGLRKPTSQPLGHRDISFAGPGKSDEELKAAVKAGILVNVESAGELARLDQAARGQGHIARLALRVNPPFELKSSGMRMGGGAKPFGIDAEQIPLLLAALPNLKGVAFEGFHVYCGSQSLQAAHVAEALSASYDLAMQLANQLPAGSHLRGINLGGGLGVPYFPGERHLDLNPIASCLADLVRQAGQQAPDIELSLELGRYLVAESGVYLTRVVDRKVSRGQVFLITDGGLNHFLAASGNFGQVIRKNYPVTTIPGVAKARQTGVPHLEQVTVAGPLCTPLDVLADKMWLPRADVGDWVAVFQAGAYGRSASPARFLGQPECSEMLV
jgi:diaminopimelate decarboxylase